MKAKKVEAEFLACLPRMEAVWRRMQYTTGFNPRDEDLLQACRGLAWYRWRRLVQEGKEPSDWPAVLAYRVWQRCSLPGGVFGTGRRHCSYADLRAAGEAIRPARNREDNPAALAVLNLDVAEWRKTLTRTQEACLDAFLQDERVKDIADRLGLSCPRISSIRHELVRSWVAFHGWRQDS